MEAYIQAWIDQASARMKETIRTHGWAIEYVGGGACDCPHCDGDGDEGPPFAYTVGLHGLGHPELLVFSLPPEISCQVLNSFGDSIRDGGDLVPGFLYDLEGFHHRFVAETLPNPHEILFTANAFYVIPNGASVPALQLTYDDGRGVFPWDEGYPVPEAQPRPGTFRA